MAACKPNGPYNLGLLPPVLNKTRVHAEVPVALQTATDSSTPAAECSSGDSEIGIDLYWLPLGAGGNFVRLNGRVDEAITARLQGRPVCDLYHSALQVVVPEGRYVIEQTPVIDADGSERGVVGEGPVGAGWAGRFRMFRYEARRWRDGLIPDLNEAVDSPKRLSRDLGQARRLLEVVPEVPMLVWGRDELKAGEMWNSNSMTSWLITRIGLDIESIKPPAGGRAPGWKAGVVAAARQTATAQGRCGRRRARSGCGLTCSCGQKTRRLRGQKRLQAHP